MFVYEKKLQYPVKIKNANPALAKYIITQYGGPDGELGASIRYLSQRYAMPYAELKGLLTDIGTEEYGLLLYQCIKPTSLSPERKITISP
ncbi:MAG: manganese containing catalase [Clostridia bacterium]|nr:manganese containing catalase [Clostridia bacterium]